MSWKDWLSPGSAIGKNAALNGIEGSLAAAYVAAYLDEDQLQKILINADPEQKEQLENILEAYRTGSGIARLTSAIQNFGPQVIISMIAGGAMSAKEVREAHKNLIEQFDDKDIPGFKHVQFEINGKPVEVFIDASGSAKTNDGRPPKETEYYANFDRSNMTSAEIKAAKAEIQKQIELAEREVSQVDAYDISKSILKIFNPELAQTITDLENNGLGRCLPITEGGPTKDVPEICTAPNMNGGLY